MISRQAKYALRALIGLARANGEWILAAELARRQRIPKKFLEHIVLILKRDGLVKSRRGNQGGYVLLKPPEAITFAQAIRLIDGPLAPLPCLSITAYSRCRDCPDEARCEVRRAFARVADISREILGRTTIADAVQLAVPWIQPQRRQINCR